ncbi:two-component regulator propeller domain-containing protein [Aestuariibaculum lutulentum]|uniref:histidine kinase n=1 Tax=Aestuariibaculum lutulentum TaxID=2920935 RepID=A0ABS9RLV9_9FLAO|nr:two-component regulator propeller domain-containing protein [Aestuariibaculum lutulentum]MCH4553114.1 response regulator [Aestuariibaculum lutulentum]
MISKNNIIILVFLIIEVVCYSQNSVHNNLFSEKKNLKFEHFNVESGLSNNLITDLAQDSLGYIWVSTFDGLNRYNGKNFYQYKKENNTENSLNYNFIQQSKFDAKGNLFIATGEGINIYNPKDESFNLIDEKNGLIRESLSCIEFGRNSEIILGIYGEGVQFFPPYNAENSEILTHDPDKENSLSSNNISCLLLNKNTLWVGTFNNGLNKINYDTKSVQRISLGNNELNKINCLFLDNEENLWIGTRNGIIIITEDQERIHINIGDSEHQGLSDKEILSFEQDYQGNMWVGTQNGGINIINLNTYQNGNKFIKWYLPNQNGNNFQGRGISSILRDKDDCMWIGTSFGLYFVNPKDTPIEHYKEKFTNSPISINCNYIRNIFEGSNGDIWIATDGGGVNLLNPKTGKFKYFTHDTSNPKSLSSNYIYSVLEDSKRRIWIGTYRGGLNLLDTLSGNAKKYLQGSVENGYKVNTIYEDHQKSIWIGTNRGGLYWYNEAKDEFDYISELGKIDIRDFTEDKNGNIWMATYGDGVIKFNPKTKSKEIFKADNTEGLNGNIIFSIELLPDNTILMGSAYEGLFKLYPKSRKVKNYSFKDGLSNNTINNMVYRNDNEIWLGTFNGLSYFNLSTESINNLNSFDNIPQSDFNVGAACKTKNGLLYFGSNNGLYIINPDKLFNSTIETPLIFETIKVFNEKIEISPKKIKDQLNQSLPYLKHVIFNHKQTLITIDFSVLKYPHSQNIKYSYLLNGYQNQWINIENNNSINLSKLPPGNYDLIVKGEINPEKTVTNNLLITITPPFWRTPTAYFMLLTLMIILIWFGTKYYAERIKLKNSLIFEKKQRQLENDLNQERARFFTSFSHELKTPLSLIIAPIEDLIEKVEKKKQKEQLKMVLSNSNYLLNNIQKLLEFRKSEIGLNQLSIDQANLTSHISVILNKYKSLAKSRGIILNFEKPKEDIYIWCDIEKIEIILYNLLSNAFKYSERNGTVIVILRSIDKHVQISVSDSGKGILKQDLPHIFDWYYQSNSNNRKKGSGIGLALSKQFAELHLGTLKVNSKYNHGATFTLDIPFDAFTEKTQKDSYKPILEEENTNVLNETSEIWAIRDQDLEEISLKSKINTDKNRSLILIVDDNKNILLFLSNILNDNYDLIFAENGAEGIKKAIKYVPDLVISDVMMPLKDGFDLCKTLKKEQTTSHIPIVLLTAIGNTEGINEGYKEGADDYITKPFNSKILKTRIENLIKNRLKLKDYFSNNTDKPILGLENESLLDTEKAFLDRFNQVILEHVIQNKSNINDIYHEIGMSKTSLYRKIKALTGKTVNELIQDIKLEKAYNLIKHSNLNVSQASFEVGFNSVKYFRKLFKEKYGILPSKIDES